MRVSSTYNKVAIAACKETTRYVDCCGGTRSGKTYAILQFLIDMCNDSPSPFIISVISESLPHLRRGAIKDFKEILQTEEIWNPKAWHETTKTYTFPSGSQLEFFSADNAGKVHGAKRNWLFINEAQNISWDIARQLFVRTDGLILIDYNPTHEFWVHTEIRNREGVVTINSTYKDNPFLSKEQIAEIEANKGDSSWWKVYGEGQIGKREGLIFQNWELVDHVPDNAKFIGRGLDFGYTADPTAIVDVYLHEGIMYLHERLYERGLTNDIIAKKLQIMGQVPRTVADSAELKSIQEIRNYGVRGIEPAIKGSGSILFGIDILKRFEIRVTRQSLNLIYELRNYMWKEDKLTGQLLNIPIDRYNHALDAVRYVAINMLAERRRSFDTTARTFNIA